MQEIWHSSESLSPQTKYKNWNKFGSRSDFDLWIFFEDNFQKNDFFESHVLEFLVYLKVCRSS